MSAYEHEYRVQMPDIRLSLKSRSLLSNVTHTLDNSSLYVTHNADEVLPNSVISKSMERKPTNLNLTKVRNLQSTSSSKMETSLAQTNSAFYALSKETRKANDKHVVSL